MTIITVVIVTYNSRDTIGETLDALHEAFLIGCITCVVVDNASIDNTADFVARYYPWVFLIQSPHNWGFGRGCNRGFKKVNTPYVLFLNPDAKVTPEALKILYNFLEANHNVGIVAPAIITNRGNLQAAGMMTTPASVLKTEFGCPHANPLRKEIVPGKTPFRTNWVCGAVMLIRSDLFLKLGGFDPRFFLYFEETDLCLRASKAGAEIWAVGEASATHVGGASAKTVGKPLHSLCIAEHFYQSRFYYLSKHFGFLQSILTECIIRALIFVRNIKSILSDRSSTWPLFVEIIKNFRLPSKH